MIYRLSTDTGWRNQPLFLSIRDRYKKPKKALIIRYGGFGDVLQTTTLFRPLKEEGYHITVNTTSRGHTLLQGDKLIDDFILQQTDQVPNRELREYWGLLAPGFDKVINLSESIEGGLLVPGPRVEVVDGVRVPVKAREEYYWSHEKRHTLLNRNYVEEIHRIADVPFSRPEVRFFPSPMEQFSVNKLRKKFKVKKLVVWALSGSSIHKTYPWTHMVVEDVLHSTRDYGFVFVGDEQSKLLEDAIFEYIGPNNRVIYKSGGISIRQTLALAKIGA